MLSLLSILTVVLTAAIVAVLVPIVVLSMECLVAVASRGRSTSPGPLPLREPCRLAVVIPAHNEESGLGETLSSVLKQLGPTDRVVVVADNCTDRTAEIARGCGVSVVERTHLDHRGKGYALDAGLKSLESTPPDVVVIVDADCQLEAGAITSLANQVGRSRRPAQAVYLMDPPASATTGDRLSAFAFQVKNLVRPLGLSRLGLPCLLTGTGMAFPWEQLHNVPLASGNIVEDMQLGIDLTLKGNAPHFCSEAVVTSSLPSNLNAARQQRRRWEHGHLQTMRRQVPRLLGAFIRRPRVETLAIALELAVPPWSMLIVLWTALTLGAVLLYSLSSVLTPIALIAAGWVLLSSALVATWIRFGRRVAPARVLAGIPGYVLRKIGLYWSALWSPERNWVRTDRQSVIPSNNAGDVVEASAEKVFIGAARIDNLTMGEAISGIEGLIRRRQPSIVVTPNVDHVVQLEKRPAFRAAYDDADLVLADGMPLLWAAKLLGTPLKEKVSGSDLFPRFCRLASQRKYRLYFLGGQPGAAEATAEKYRRLGPAVEIATDCPPFGFEHNSEQNSLVIQRIRDFAPDVLFVGLGCPKQELWMHRHYLEYRAPVSIGVGASFEFEAGFVRRAPRLFQRSGFEWLWRLMSEPRRMYRRYLIDDPKFVGIVWRQFRTSKSKLSAEPVAAVLTRQ